MNISALSSNSKKWRETAKYTIGPGVERAALVKPYKRKPDDPMFRPLHIYTLDSSAPSAHGAVSLVNIPYEELHPGPVGALIEVCDRDDNGQHQTDKIDLNDPRLLIQSGMRPSPANYSFHQQMVYAVCMLSYSSFKRALGRDIAWGFSRPGSNGEQPRLRIHPHAFARENAWYDQVKGELCFGYYNARPETTGRNLPNGRMYTCTMHDIIVHEMTHALLDGVRSHFTEPCGPDVHAFHEGFADLMAIFQRFGYEQVVHSAVQQAYMSGEDLDLLTRIARQFGETARSGKRLRPLLETRTVLRERQQYNEVSKEPHALGSLLVSAVLDASVTIFQRKVAPYIRLASGGTGVLPQGALPHDLHDILTRNAMRLAEQFHTICVRAIDYCPPVDLDFGDFLRAVITADRDLVPADPWGYREAWIDAFRQRSIYPRGVDALVEEALVWNPPERNLPEIEALSFAELRFRGAPSTPATCDELCRQANALGEVVVQPQNLEIFGCAGAGDARLRGDEVEPPSIESIRTSQRVGPDGQVVCELVAEVIQKRYVAARGGLPPFTFYGGATVIVDPNGKIRYVIRKRITNERRLQRQRDYMKDARGQSWNLNAQRAHPLSLHEAIHGEENSI